MIMQKVMFNFAMRLEKMMLTRWFYRSYFECGCIFILHVDIDNVILTDVFRTESSLQEELNCEIQ